MKPIVSKFVLMACLLFLGMQSTLAAEEVSEEKALENARKAKDKT